MGKDKRINNSRKNEVRRKKERTKIGKKQIPTRRKVRSNLKA